MDGWRTYIKRESKRRCGKRRDVGLEDLGRETRRGVGGMRLQSAEGGARQQEMRDGKSGSDEKKR